MSEYREVLVQERVTALQKEVAEEIIRRLSMVDLTDLSHGIHPPDLNGCLAAVRRCLMRESGPLAGQGGTLRRVAEQQLLQEAFGKEKAPARGVHAGASDTQQQVANAGAETTPVRRERISARTV